MDYSTLNSSDEIIEALKIVAGENEAEIVRVWEDPTEEEVQKVLEIAKKIARENGEEEIFWGIERHEV